MLPGTAYAHADLPILHVSLSLLDGSLVLCTAVAVGPAQAHTLEERMKQLQEQPQQQSQSAQVSSSGGGRASPGCFSAGARSGSGPSSALAPWPAACRNAYAECEPPPPAQVNSYTCQKSFKVNAASAAALSTTAVMLCKSNVEGTHLSFAWTGHADIARSRTARHVPGVRLPLTQVGLVCLGQC